MPVASAGSTAGRKQSFMCSALQRWDWQTSSSCSAVAESAGADSLPCHSCARCTVHLTEVLRVCMGTPGFPLKLACKAASYCAGQLHIHRGRWSACGTFSHLSQQPAWPSVRTWAHCRMMCTAMATQCYSCSPRAGSECGVALVLA